jgi:HPt (histidine-containing phosphotransfer) domain-containing protein
MAKSFLILVLGLVVGVAVGLWQPTGELVAMRGQLAQNEREMASLRRQSATSGIAGLFHPASRSKAAAAPVEGGTAAEPNATGEAPPDANGVHIELGEGKEQPPLLEQAETLEGAAEALDARAAQARAALVEQSDLSDDELAAFDAAIDKLNERLRTSVDALATQMAAGKEPDRRELMELGAEGLDAMIEADDAINAAIPQEVRESIDDELLDPFSHVDGSTLASLSQLEGQ